VLLLAGRSDLSRGSVLCREWSVGGWVSVRLVQVVREESGKGWERRQEQVWPSLLFFVVGAPWCYVVELR
jgi:hypothetical protein